MEQGSQNKQQKIGDYYMQTNLTQQVLQEIRERLLLRVFSISLEPYTLELVKKDDILDVLDDYQDTPIRCVHRDAAGLDPITQCPARWE